MTTRVREINEVGEDFRGSATVIESQLYEAAEKRRARTHEKNAFACGRGT